MPGGSFLFLKIVVCLDVFPALHLYAVFANLAVKLHVIWTVGDYSVVEWSCDDLLYLCKWHHHGWYKIIFGVNGDFQSHERRLSVPQIHCSFDMQ